ncbi:hypothetical protein, partial [Methanobrevibacter sp.]|uniref:hypothetical protein n=1 Tax=Methanobrevibacter sp. TaxID=66852 RepID=UPI002E77DAFD
MLFTFFSPIRKSINEEIDAFDQIPLKTQAKTEHYKLNSATIFWHDVYARRMNVENVISVIKIRSHGKNYNRCTKLQIELPRLWRSRGFLLHGLILSHESRITVLSPLLQRFIVSSIKSVNPCFR